MGGLLRPHADRDAITFRTERLDTAQQLNCVSNPLVNKLRLYSYPPERIGLSASMTAATRGTTENKSDTDALSTGWECYTDRYNITVTGPAIDSLLFDA